MESWDSLLKFALVLSFGALGALMIYIKAYSRRKGELIAELEESPIIKKIEAQINQSSAIQSHFGEKKLNSYERLGSLIEEFQVDYEKLLQWENRLEDDELARIALNIPTDVRQKEILDLRDTLKLTSTRERWLWHWKVSSIVYVVESLLFEVHGALAYYDQETIDWEVKRHHFEAAIEYSSLIMELSSSINDEIRNELVGGDYLAGLTSGEEEFQSYARWLGDKKRVCSRSIADKNPELHERIRSSIERQLKEANKQYREHLKQQIPET